MQNNSKCIFRKAIESDVTNLSLLENDVWGDNGANETQLLSRIKTFPDGNTIAIVDGKIVGYVGIEFVNDMFNKEFTWDAITDNGMIAKSHQPNGEYAYGLNLSVHHSANGRRISDALILLGLQTMVIYNRKGGFIGSRIPFFKKYKESHPDTSVDEYIKLKRNGKPRDYELRLYGEAGFVPVTILPDYFPDPESLNYGVLVYRKNPFYNKPFRKFLAWGIGKIALKIVKTNNV